MISGMERVVLITSLIGCIIVWHSVSADITFNPRDTESRVNDSTYFNCSTDILSKQIHWSHDGKYVYAGGVFYEPYLRRFQIEINNSTGAYNLIIPSVESQDVGEYSCQDDGGHGKISFAKLIVLAEEPTCQIEDGNSCGIVPDKVLLSCNVIFHGSIPPRLEWRKAGGNSLVTDVTCVVYGNSTTCTATLKTDLSMNNQSYLCQTTRSVTRQYQCYSEIIRPPYAFNSTERVNATIGEEVKCFANSSQSCSYKWIWFNGSQSVTVSTDQTFKPMEAGPYRCEATCHIGNISCVVDAKFVEVHSTQSPEASTEQYSQVLWILLVTILLVVIVISVMLYLRRRRANQRLSGSKGAENLKTEQSSTLLMTVIDEDNKQAKERDGEPKNEELVTNNGDQSMPLMAPKSDDEEQMKQSLAEPEQGPQALSLLEGKAKCVDVIRREFDEGKQIVGVTALKDKLFVVSENSPAVEVYDAANKYALISRVPIPELVNPFDLSSCHKTDCVFISDSKVDSKPKEIIRIVSSLVDDKRWSTGDDFGNLSVSSESNIIMCVSEKKKLIEYTRDGKNIREINLPGITHPRHAIKLNDGHFVISLGCKDDPLHQVCNVNVDGGVLKLVKSFGEEKGSSLEHLNEPNYLIVDEKGFVLVGDTGNKRVLLLDSDLKLKGEFFAKHDVLVDPNKMCVSIATRNLFLVEKACTVSVFSII